MEPEQNKLKGYTEQTHLIIKVFGCLNSKNRKYAMMSIFFIGHQLLLLSYRVLL